MTETSSTEPAATRRSRATDVAMAVLIWAVLAAIPLGTIGGGAWLLVQRSVGTAVEATVLDCESSSSGRRGSGSRTSCVARWTVDGETVTGTLVGSNGDSDVGKTIDATVRGDTAYSRSLGLPIALIALGLPFLLLLLAAIRSKLAGRAGT